MICPGRCEEGAIEQRRNEIEDIIKSGYDRGIALTPDRLRELMREEEELKARYAKLACSCSTISTVSTIRLTPLRGFIPRGAWLN